MDSRNEHIRDTIRGLEMILQITPDYAETRRIGVTDDDAERIVADSVSSAIEILEDMLE